MNIFYVYAHPNSSSFNHLLKTTGCELLNQLPNTLLISDLYANNFNAVASWHDFNSPEPESHSQYFLAQQNAYHKQALVDEIASEIDKLSWADHIIFQFPLWWFSVPAIMKGWFDRVLVKGFAYDTGKVFSEGFLKGKKASLVVTTHSPESAYQLDGLHGVKIDSFLHPVQHTLRFVGIEVVPPFVVYNAFNIDELRQLEVIQNYHQYLRDLFT